jgi:hypothetical protein
VVLYGGATDVTDVGDTWSWDGSSWTLVTQASAPGGRYNPALAYDTTRQRIVLFGGQGADSQPLGDTWTWDGTTWTQMAPTSAPSPRAGALVAWDNATQNIVLFGGCCAGDGSELSDTWTWDGATWTLQAPATVPPASETASLAYDAARQKVVLFGGCCGASGTWTWDGTNWTQKATTATPTLGGQMAYDDAAQTIVLLQTDGSIWTWDGSTWSPVSTGVAPAGRNQAGMAYDPVTQTVVLFGGSNNGTPQNDTWNWNGSTWTLVTGTARPNGPGQ